MYDTTILMQKCEISIKLQESDYEQAEAGRVPRTIEVELTEDLVDTCIPGDIISVSFPPCLMLTLSSGFSRTVAFPVYFFAGCWYNQDDEH